MVRRPNAILVSLVALVLAAALPGAVHATDPAPQAAGTAGATPLDLNLLRNPSFESNTADGSIPGWIAEGGVRVERFGSRPWPYPAYGRKYGGGKQYLACRGSAGLVRQTVPFSGFTDHEHPLKAHLVVDFGGTIRHAIRVTLRATGPGGVERHGRRTKPLTITNSYKRVVAWVVLPEGTDQLEATVELLGPEGGPGCRMVADKMLLEVFRPHRR